MPRFFFNVRDGADISSDREGQELPDAGAARREAINTGREMVGERLLHGGAINNRQIEITDETGCVVDVVEMSEVLFKRGGQLRTYDDDVTRSAPKNEPSQ